jgi:hypothetical protein
MKMKYIWKMKVNLLSDGFSLFRGRAAVYKVEELKRGNIKLRTKDSGAYRLILTRQEFSF